MSEIAIFADSRAHGFCRSCGATIEWAETVLGKRMPFDRIVVARTQPDLLTQRLVAYVDTAAAPTHWTTCPDAKTWRRR